MSAEVHVNMQIVGPLVDLEPLPAPGVAPERIPAEPHLGHVLGVAEHRGHDHLHVSLEDEFGLLNP